MKFVYIFLVLALIGGGAYLMVNHVKTTQEAAQTPEGYHKMDDGTLMNNTSEMENKNSDTSEKKPEASAEKMDIKSSSTIALDAQASVTLDAKAKVFEVKGINYSFDIKEIKVKKGDTVTINFTSTDGFHDWVVDEFNAKTSSVQPGVPTSVTFVADKAGTFEYYCSIGSHRAHGMVGKLIVEE